MDDTSWKPGTLPLASSPSKEEVVPFTAATIAARSEEPSPFPCANAYTDTDGDNDEEEEEEEEEEESRASWRWFAWWKRPSMSCVPG